MLGRDEDALQWFDRAAALRSDFIDALTNKAASLQQLHRFEEAAATYRQAKAIDPGDAETDWNLSLLQLLTGNFEEGWAGREARWNARRAETSLTFPGPKWRGEEDVAGKTILIYMDEGLGDAIQFARYVPEVAARGAHVLIVEPISGRVTPWWTEWRDAVRRAGGRADEWRFESNLPELVSRLARAAGLNHRELTVKSLWL